MQGCELFALVDDGFVQGNCFSGSIQRRNVRGIALGRDTLEDPNGHVNLGDRVKRVLMGHGLGRIHRCHMHDAKTAHGMQELLLCLGLCHYVDLGHWHDHTATPSLALFISSFCISFVLAILARPTAAVI